MPRLVCQILCRTFQEPEPPDTRDKGWTWEQWQWWVEQRKAEAAKYSRPLPKPEAKPKRRFRWPFWKKVK